MGSCIGCFGPGGLSLTPLHAARPWPCGTGAKYCWCAEAVGAASPCRGGGLRLGESSNQTVRRWLDRELGIRLPEERFWLAWHGTLRFESRLDTMDIWEVFLETPPRIRFDVRRITWAGWMTPATAMKKRLVPSVMLYIFGRSGELIQDKSLSWPHTVEFPAL